MRDSSARTTIAVCETQPVTAEGVKCLLSACGDLEFVAAAHSLQASIEMVQSRRPNLVLADKALGIHPLAQWIVELHTASPAPAVVVWGASVTEAEALRLIQGGARGVIRKTADASTLLACLRAAAVGMTWMEDSIFREPPGAGRPNRSGLTSREGQVARLAEQGLNNREIAMELGIRPGTVKIHLKHIFEKTGVHGRHGLALSALKQRGLLAVPHDGRLVVHQPLGITSRQ